MAAKAKRKKQSPFSSDMPTLSEPAGPQPPEGMSEASPDDGMSTNEKLWMSAIALLSPVVGGMLGGSQGAMAGGARGLEAVGTGLEEKNKADWAEEQQEREVKLRQQERQEDYEDFVRKQAAEKQIESQFDDKKSGEPEYKKVGDSLVKIEDGKATPVYKAPSKPQDAGPSYGNKVVDREFGKEYADYVAGGGFSDTYKQLDQLEEVAEKLDETDMASGPIIGKLPDFAREWFTPEGFDMQQAVEEVVQRNLKKVLGGQFTEKEGENLVKRAYNPNLDESTNKKRVKRLINQIRIAARQKERAARYYEENGTLRGFKGRLPKMSDFTDLYQEPSQKSGRSAGASTDRSAAPRGTPPPGRSADDDAAIEWLKNNPDDPRSDAIRQKLESKGML